MLSNENRLKQILLNFLSNSIKFTKQGYIKLNATHSTIHKTIEIIVKDSGIGIKKEEQGLIFQENVMLNHEEKYNFKGSGLGLSICRTMAKSLGHDIGFN